MLYLQHLIALTAKFYSMHIIFKIGVFMNVKFSTVSVLIVGVVATSVLTYDFLISIV